MRNIATWIGYNLFPICCLGVAVYMMHSHIKGYGWLIAIAAMCAVMPDSSKK